MIEVLFICGRQRIPRRRSMESYTQVANAVYLTVGIIAAAITIMGGIFIVVKFVLKIKGLIKEVEALKEEDTLICYALSECLDGLIQLGANHTVPIAKDKLDKYLHKKAHGQK